MKRTESSCGRGQPDDIDLTLHAFEKSRIANEVVVAKDGEEALAYLFATRRSRRIGNPTILPDVVLLGTEAPH